jgi:hypothetical protein
MAAAIAEDGGASTRPRFAIAALDFALVERRVGEGGLSAQPPRPPSVTLRYGLISVSAIAAAIAKDGDA